MITLFCKGKVNIVDGDDRLNQSDPVYRKNLVSLLDNGMSLYGIQIFHYAAPHYSSRHNRPMLRFLNGLINGFSAIEYDSGNLVINNFEGSELQRDSSEVIAIGLTNMIICKWFEISANRLSTIEGSGKRCDFKFRKNNKEYVYEVRGRKNKSQLTSALKDAHLKKNNQSGDIKLAMICHLPRDKSPITVNIYDPELEQGQQNDEIYNVLRYYLNFVRISGLHIIATELERRIYHYKRTREWMTGPIEYDSNVKKMMWSFSVGNTEYLSLLYPASELYDQNSNNYSVHFGLSKDVLELLEKWDIDGLMKYEGLEIVDEQQRFSCLKDGSIMFLKLKESSKYIEKHDRLQKSKVE